MIELEDVNDALLKVDIRCVLDKASLRLAMDALDRKMGFVHDPSSLARSY